MSDDTNGGPVAAEELRLLIERIERLEEEKKAIADDIKGVYGEAKSRGFDTKAMKAIVRLRKLTPDQRREQEAMIDTYRAALGMLDGTPLGRWAVDRLTKRDAPSAEEQSPEDLAKYARAVEIVLSSRKASTAYLQRTLSIGYNSAAKLVEQMERDGLVSKPDHLGRREVLAPPPEGSDSEDVEIE